MTTHTKEPWGHSSQFIVGPKSLKCLGECYSDVSISGPENTKRIITCVNACRGIADPAQAIDRAREALEGLIKQIELAHWHEDHLKPAREALALLGAKEEA